MPDKLFLAVLLLQQLSLGGNRLYGTLPHTLGVSSNLAVLDVGRNSNLMGPLPATLATALPSLVVLDIGLTNITTVGDTTIAAFCNRTTDGPMEIWADCGDAECPCCAYCCNKTSGTCWPTKGGTCSKLEFQLENQRGGFFEEFRGTKCNCSEQGQVLSCSDMPCQAW